MGKKDLPTEENMKPTIKELLEKITRLEARILQLEGSQTIHHYHHQVPSYQQLPYYQPVTSPIQPWMITCGGST